MVIHQELDSCLVVTGTMEFDGFPLGTYFSEGLVETTNQNR
jgi:hypothetical protein